MGDGMGKSKYTRKHGLPLLPEQKEELVNRAQWEDLNVSEYIRRQLFPQKEKTIVGDIPVTGKRTKQYIHMVSQSRST